MMSGFNEGIYERPVDGTLNIVGQNNLEGKINLWEESVEAGNAFELSAVANGAYAIPIGAKVALVATPSDLTEWIMKGYFINSDKNPFDITFYESPTIVIGAGVAVPMTPVNRNRKSTKISYVDISMIIGITSITGTELTPIGAYAGSTSFNFANVDGLPEHWVLDPTKTYAVYLYNKSGAIANLVARMFWTEKKPFVAGD